MRIASRLLVNAFTTLMDPKMVNIDKIPKGTVKEVFKDLKFVSSC